MKIKSIEEFLIDKNINEMSKIVDVPKSTLKGLIDLSSRYLQMFKGEYIPLENKGNIFFTSTSMESIVVYRGTKDHKDGGSSLIYGKININKILYEYFTPLATMKLLDSDTKGLMIDLYRFISKEFKTYILSDEKQTIDSKEVWKRWYNNPSKYKIKDIFCIDIESKRIINFEDIEDSWCRNDECKKYRILAKW